MSLLPLLALRKLLISFTRPENVIARGFNPPGVLADKILRMAMTAELAVSHDVPWGTSLLAVARKSSDKAA